MLTLQAVLHQVELLVLFLGWFPSAAVYRAAKNMLHPLARSRMFVCLGRVPFYTVPRGLDFKDAMGALWRQTIGRLQETAAAPGFAGTRQVVVRYRSTDVWHTAPAEPLAVEYLDRELWRVGFENARDVFWIHGKQFETRRISDIFYPKFAQPIWFETRCLECVLASGFEVSLRATFHGRAAPLRQ